MNQPLATPLTATFDEAQVSDYLAQHPDFFQRHPDLLNALRIPHASGGTVSLVERQVDNLRQQNQALKRQLSQLMSVAANNERLYRIYGALDMRLVACQRLEDLVAILFDGMCAQLGHASMTLTLLREHDTLPLHCQGIDPGSPALTQLLGKRLDGDTPYFGRLGQDEKALLQLDELVQSVALLKLDNLGILAVGSVYAEHFHPQMGSLLIGRLADLVTYRLHQFLEQP